MGVTTESDGAYSRIVMRPDATGQLVAVAVTESLPQPAAHQVLIAVSASGLNRADLLQRDGDYLPPAGESDTPGLEAAGVIISIGSEVTSVAAGDRVCALLGSGGHATHVLARADLVAPLADTITDLDAAALPEALATAWWNLVELARVHAGDRVLIYGANSGVGHLAGQAALALGATVIAATRGTQHHAELTSMGFTCIDMSGPDAAAAILAEASGGIDIVLDLVGASFAEVTQSVLGHGGRWLSIGLLGGETVPLSLRKVIRNRWIITGSSLRSLTPAERARAMAGVRTQLWPSVASGDIRARIDSVFDYRDTQAALEHLERGGVFGKIILSHSST